MSVHLLLIKLLPLTFVSLPLTLIAVPLIANQPTSNRSNSTPNERSLGRLILMVVPNYPSYDRSGKPTENSPIPRVFLPQSLRPHYQNG
jgi:hypothetical protein